MIPYSLHVAIILSVCLTFYKLLLQKQTYHRLNRLVLLACLILSFLLPLVPIPGQISFLNVTPLDVSSLQSKEVDVELPKVALPKLMASQPVGIRSASEKKAQTILNKQAMISWIVGIYWFGVAAFGINFLIQIIVLLYQSYKNPSIQDGIYRIVELDTNKAPCSFGSHIFINPAKYDWDTYSQILIHEKIHVKEKHSIDLLLAELMLAVQWFNPLAWLYRKEIENNLEFLTDDVVLQQHNIDPVSYQLSLLKVSVPNYSMRLSTNYNQSLLKKRIIMMDAKRSNVHSLWKYLMLLPLMAFMVCTLNQRVVGKNTSMVHQQSKETALLKNQGYLQQKEAPKERTADSTGKVVLKRTSRGSVKVSEINQAFAKNSSPDTLLWLREQSITPLTIHNFEDVGFKARHYTDWIILKKYNINPADVKQFIDLGFKRISADELSTLSDLKISPDYIKSFQAIGYQQSPLNHFYIFKARGITTDYINGFTQLGFSNIPFQDLTSIKAVGITPKFIADMQQQGYHYKEVKKYIQLLPFKRKLMKDSTYQVLLPPGGG